MGSPKYTLEEIQKKIDAIFGVGLITVVPGQEYIGIRSPLRFIDRDYGEWSIAPFNIITNKNTHPERSRERRKQTNIKKYGHENAFGSAEIKEKIKKVNLEKYGVENPTHLQEVKERIKQTNLLKYGCETPISQNAEVVRKAKDTNLERYGVENPAHSEALQKKKAETCLAVYGTSSPLENEGVKAKIRQTNMDNLGVNYPMQSSQVREKVKTVNIERYGGHPLTLEKFKTKRRTTCIERYGVESPTQVNSPVLPNGLLLSQYLKHHECPLWYSSCSTVYTKYGFEVLRDYVEFGKKFGKDTALEAAVAAALELAPYKKKLVVINRYPDFELSPGVYLDIDGLYWHSDPVKKDKMHHFNKRLQYEQAGLRLIQMHEDEFINKPAIVKSLVTNALSKSQKIYARNCQIRGVLWSSARIFLDTNHLQGEGTFSRCHGLYYKDSLVMLIGIRKNSSGIEISRLCSLAGHQVVGGFSRLLKHVTNIYKPQEIHSWCDLRYASGKGYEAVGFKKVRDTLGWMWTDFHNTYNRRRCRANMDERRLSEQEHAEERGWVKIYDAGQRLYVKPIGRTD